MAITEPDLKYFHAEEVSSASTNGGLMSQTEVVSGVKNNLWENASASDRADGRTDWRKVFGSPQSDTDDQLITPKTWNHAPTPGDDYVLMYPGTKTDTQGTVVTTRAYGAGQLKNDVSAGATSIVVTVEHADMVDIFVNGDLFVISDKESPELTGNAEVDKTVTAVPTAVGLDITLQVDALTNSYLAADTVVSSVYEPGTTESAIGTIVITSASGTTDEATYPPVLNNRGTVDESLTFSFSDATNFSVSGSRSGALASGTTTADYTAINPDNTKDLITLPNGFFSGTYASLDTVVIPTIANNFAFWLNRIIPAGSSTLNGDLNISAYSGES